MIIEFIQSMATEHGYYGVGSLHEVDNKRGAELINQKIAQPVKLSVEVADVDTGKTAELVATKVKPSTKTKTENG